MSDEETKTGALDLSALYGDPDKCATKFDINGFRFYLRSWSDEAATRNRTTAARMAAALGMTVDEADAVQLGSRHTESLIAFNDADREFYVNDAVMGIGLTQGPTSKQSGMEKIEAAAIMKMRADVVVPLVDFIIAFNRDGVSESQFFRQRGK